MSKDMKIAGTKDLTVAEQEAKKSKLKVNLKYLRDKYREPVKGIFKFYEVPGGCMSFSYKEFKEDQVENYTMVDGEIYTIPLGVAKHLNKNGWYPVHSYQVDENGRPAMRIGQKVRRFGFQSLEFIDAEDLTEEGSGIVTAEMMG